MKFKFTTLIMATALLLSGSLAWSQSQSPLDIALRQIEQNHKKWNLTKEDVSDMVVTDMYQSKHNGVTHIYFIQRYQGIALQNAIMNFNIMEDGKVLYTGKRFFPNLSSAVNSTSASINADQALQRVLDDLNISAELPRLAQEEDNLFTYDNTGISNYDIKIELTYKEIDAEIFLAWNLMIAPVGNIDVWNYSIDANSGQIIEKKDMVIRCKFKKDAYHNHNANCDSENLLMKSAPNVQQALTQTSSTTLAGSYRVYAFPTQSPIHGPHEVVTDPADITASPYGWHDINGDITPEYTITRGNNVHAYEDRDGDGASSGNEPDGGMGLTFDFPYSADGEAVDNADAATVNLFYMNNTIHDFTYQYGFDEAAGNFQNNNYGNGGFGNDEVLARAQQGADTGNENNANFSTPTDGGNGVMNMYVWSNPGNKNFNVTAPSSIAGQYTSIQAAFGPAITDIPVSGEVIEVDDGVYNPYLTDACEDFVNPGDFDGKIALIDRGGCEFGAKVLRAEEAGAVAVIVCNFDPDPITMGAGAVGDQVAIPSIMIGVDDCQTIRQFAGNGLEVTLVIPPANPGPDFLDGDFDNGIIAHEYGHGISNRLTGGPNQGCLGGDEQMGEGWSDFFTLITSVHSGDDGETGRGVGTYVERQEIDGPGIRQYRYSTDMNVNPHTYADIASVVIPHGVGSVWAAMLWDLYWALVDEHGFDDDQWTGTGGNNMAIQLVMDGMKMQGCSPGFVDGRDAILAADTALYAGANGCLIWEVFARRGCGVYADQGSSADVGDETISFEALPTCIVELKIKKTVSPLVNAGDDIDVSITITNHKNETLTGIVVTDEIVTGTGYVNGSASSNVVEGGVNGGFVSFELGTMEYLEEVTFTYKMSTDESSFSIRHFYDDMEDADTDFFWFPFTIMGDNYWVENTTDANSGTTSWYVENTDLETQQILQAGQTDLKIMVEGDLPVLRFYHQYNTEPAADGGVVQISTDEGTTWQELALDWFRNPYSSIQYGTFVIPDYSAFSGFSEGWIASYADLSAWADQEVILRFHFRSDDNTVPASPAGWWVDDLEIMDMIYYNSTACVASDQGDQACFTPDEKGTIIESQVITSTEDPEQTVFLNVFPNPTDDVINLSISSLQNEDVTISILTLDGRVVGGKAISTSTTTQTFSVNVSDLPAGFYFVKASTNNDVTIKKVVVH